MAMHSAGVYFPDELWADLQREAARLDCSISEVVRECVEEALRKRRLAKIRKGLPK